MLCDKGFDVVVVPHLEHADVGWVLVDCRLAVSSVLGMILVGLSGNENGFTHSSCSSPACLTCFKHDHFLTCSGFAIEQEVSCGCTGHPGSNDHHIGYRWQ